MAVTAVVTPTQKTTGHMLQAGALLRQIKGNYAPRFIKCDPFKTVHYGKVAVLELEEAAVYSNIELVTNLPYDRIERISLEYQDGSEFSTVTPKFLKARDQYNKRTVKDCADDGVEQSRLYLEFADERMRTTDGIRRGELVVLPGETIRVKVHLATKAVDDPDVPELYANAWKQDPQIDRYFVKRDSEQILSQTITGEQTHKFPLMGINHRIRRMWLETDKITYFAIIKDRKIVFEGDVADYVANLERETDKTVPQGWLPIDFIYHGFASESSFIPTALQSLQLKLRSTAAQEIPIYFEYLTQNKEIPTPQTQATNR